jgi:hypothetical protein
LPHKCNKKFLNNNNLKKTSTMVEELERLKKYLPKGYSIRLAEEFGVTQVTITHALMGRYRRFDIIERAVEMAQENIAILKRVSSCGELYKDYVITDKYFSPKQYTKIRRPGIKGGYYDKNTYIPDTYIVVFRQADVKYANDRYESFSKSFYDRIIIYYRMHY